MSSIEPEKQPLIKKSLDIMNNFFSRKKNEKSFLKQDPEIELGDKKFILASLNRRIIASTLDIIFLSIIITPLNFLLSIFGFGKDAILQHQGPIQDPSAAMLLRALKESGLLEQIIIIQSIVILSLALYNILFLWKKSATPGKMLLKCQVLDGETGGKISIKQAIVRFCATPLSIMPLLIGLFMIDWTKKRQSLHDKIAGTVVVLKK